MKMRAAIFYMCLFCVASGCYYDKEEFLYPSNNNCLGTTPSFNGQIRPLVETRCAISGCHDATSTNVGGPFTNYTLIKNHSDHIREEVISGRMPEGSSLTVSEIRLIKCWIDSGAPDN